MYTKINVVLDAIRDFERSLSNLEGLSVEMGKPMIEPASDSESRSTFLSGVEQNSLTFKELWDYLPTYVYCSGARLNLATTNIGQVIFAPDFSCIGSAEEEVAPVDKLRELDECFIGLDDAISNLRSFINKATGEEGCDDGDVCDAKSEKREVPVFDCLWNNTATIIREKAGFVDAYEDAIRLLVLGEQMPNNPAKPEDGIRMP